MQVNADRTRVFVGIGDDSDCGRIPGRPARSQGSERRACSARRRWSCPEIRPRRKTSSRCHTVKNAALGKTAPAWRSVAGPLLRGQSIARRQNGRRDVGQGLTRGAGRGEDTAGRKRAGQGVADVGDARIGRDVGRDDMPDGGPSDVFSESGTTPAKDRFVSALKGRHPPLPAHRANDGRWSKFDVRSPGLGGRGSAPGHVAAVGQALPTLPLKPGWRERCDPRAAPRTGRFPGHLR